MRLCYLLPQHHICCPCSGRMKTRPADISSMPHGHALQAVSSPCACPCGLEARRMRPSPDYPFALHPVTDLVSPAVAKLLRRPVMLCEVGCSQQLCAAAAGLTDGHKHGADCRPSWKASRPFELLSARPTCIGNPACLGRLDRSSHQQLSKLWPDVSPRCSSPWAAGDLVLEGQSAAIGAPHWQHPGWGAAHLPWSLLQPAPCACIIRPW